ncbi:MAG: FadR/GntR family transcriptional regulator [Clostridium sp.]
MSSDDNVKIKCNDKRNTKSLGEQISEQIAQLIIDNDWKVGDKLPNEFELAKMLNVGRSTIREAIKALTSRNILEIRRGAGTFISQKRGIVDDPLGLAFVKDKLKLATDLLEVRFMIEPEIAAMAAIKATDEEIKKMTELCDEVEKLIINREEHGSKDIEFHTQIASSSKNSIVANLIPIINQSITISIDVTKRRLEQETIDTHREVLNAIKNHDPKAAHDAMYLHLVYNRRNIKKIIENNKIIE